MDALVADAERLRVAIDAVVPADDSPSGSRWRLPVDADDVVVAAGAVESARLLLASGSDRAPAGLGNAHDQVGRHLQGHLYGGATGIFEDVVNDLVGPGPSIATHDFRLIGSDP
jgi:choline dehydrogenase-like flavoprotein